MFPINRKEDDWPRWPDTHARPCEWASGSSGTDSHEQLYAFFNGRNCTIPWRQSPWECVTTAVIPEAVSIAMACVCYRSTNGTFAMTAYYRDAIEQVLSSNKLRHSVIPIMRRCGRQSSAMVEESLDTRHHVGPMNYDRVVTLEHTHIVDNKERSSTEGDSLFPHLHTHESSQVHFRDRKNATRKAPCSVFAGRMTRMRHTRNIMKPHSRKPFIACFAHTHKVVHETILDLDAQGWAGQPLSPI